MSKGLKPEIRFEEFEVEWEKCNFEEIFIVENFSSFSTEKELNGKFPIIQQGLNPILGYSNKEPNKEFEKYIVFGDHSLSLYLPNRPFLVAPDGIKLLNVNIPRYFFFQLLLKNLPEHRGYQRHLGLLKENQYFISNQFQEQQKIANLFKNIDDQIQPQDQKIQKLENVKKELLQKMFADKENLVPKIRFKGFEGEWEYIKIKDISSFENGFSYEKYINKYGKFKIINLNSVTVNGLLNDNKKKTDFAKKILEKDSIIIILSDIASGSLIGKTTVIPEENKYVLNQRVGSLVLNSKNNDSFFISKVINNNSEYFSSISSGTAQLNISKNDVLEMEIYITKQLFEQQKIAKLFTTLDNVIKLNKQKLEKLQNIKTTLLQKMFV
ncbi:restriction endonuclease subunit S [Mycoplasma leonicaptivi]|uniref:restriction endonuclease subunit S n=1 Tax=Mycoplasma leonicaptivi TaxID=36742 RepID=UPI0004863D1F|nr:restriction endonuclease subunit S [Mycoplasma leonicaptivi]